MRRETRPERLSATESMQRRNDDRMNVILRSVFAEWREWAARREVELLSIPGVHDNPAVQGHLEWYRKVHDVCNWLSTHYRTSQHSKIEVDLDGDVPNTPKPG